MKIETPPCPHCGLTTVLEVSESSYQLWKEGALIQRAFPLLSRDDRETLLTGYHPECWDADWKEE